MEEVNIAITEVEEEVTIIVRETGLDGIKAILNENVTGGVNRTLVITQHEYDDLIVGGTEKSDTLYLIPKTI
jgi:hypothetical protein